MNRRPTPHRALDELARCVEMGNQALAQNRLCEAERLYRQVIAHAPAVPEAHNNLGTVLKEQGRLLEARQCFEKALRLRPTYTGAHSNLLFTLQYAPGQTLAGLRQAHEAWARVQLACIRPKAPTDFPARNTGPLVVGLTTDTGAATYAVLWQDTLGAVHMSIGTEVAGNDTGDDTDVEVVASFTGLTITGIASAIDTGDFIIF